MSDTEKTEETKQPAKKSKDGMFFLIVIGALVLLGVAQYIARTSTVQPSEQQTEEVASAPETVTQEDSSAPAVAIDVAAALSERILGDTGAPVKISEHASFTCSHCAVFHKDVFGKLKADYIDTGKAYLVFSDFPLNAPALDATMAARCLPHDRYFDFIAMLFAEQDKWAYDEHYIGFLKQKAAENGLDEAHFDACIANQELKDGIAARMKAAQEQWNISSTPSFVFNNKKTVSGAMPIEEFEKTINEEISAGDAPAPAPAETSPADAVPEEESVPAAGEPAPAEKGGESAPPAE